MEVNVGEEENELELTFPYDEADPLNPLPPASDSKSEDVTIPNSVHEIASLLRRVCIHEMTHALVKKKGKSKDKYHGKLISDLGNEVRSSVERLGISQGIARKRLFPLVQMLSPFGLIMIVVRKDIQGATAQRRTSHKVEMLVVGPTYSAFERHLEEIHLSLAHLEKKRTRLRTYTNISQEFLLRGWRRRHNSHRDGVTTFHDGVSSNDPTQYLEYSTHDSSICSLCYLFRNPFSSTTMGDENPIRTLGDYSKPSHEGYRNTIELPVGNNVVPLRSDTIRLVQNGCSFHGLRSEDPNQHLKDFLKLVDSLDLDGENRERTRLRLFQFSLRDQASNWLERLSAGSITTWEDLTTRFLS
ncbi:hypothetical protein Tco_0134481 [Tanacetum coccineum]